MFNFDPSQPPATLENGESLRDRRNRTKAREAWLAKYHEKFEWDVLREKMGVKDGRLRVLLLRAGVDRSKPNTRNTQIEERYQERLSIMRTEGGPWTNQAIVNRFKCGASTAHKLYTRYLAGDGESKSRGMTFDQAMRLFAVRRSSNG